MNSPDGITPLTGWKLWAIEIDARNEPHLVSPSRPIVWPARAEVEATCAHGHEAVQLSCTCGIYATATLALLLRLGYGPPRAHDENAPVAIGTVALWGNVIETTHGFRAQYAYPQTVYLLHEHWRVAQALERRYAVPVHVKNLYRLET